MLRLVILLLPKEVEEGYKVVAIDFNGSGCKKI